MRRFISLLLLVALGSGVAWADGQPTGPWRPDITERPRLFCGPDDRAALLAREDAEPYATLLARIRGAANRSFSPTPPDTYDASREYALSNIAKAAAFLAWMEQDAAMADKAASALEAIATDFGPVSYDLIDADIHTAEAVYGFAVAYDFLAGSASIEPARLADIEALLGGMVADWYAWFIDDLALVQAIRVGNHKSKVGAAFALAAMALNQRDDAATWFNYGLTTAYEVHLETELQASGVNAEGTYYNDYAAVNVLPAFLAYHRLVGAGDTLLARQLCVYGPLCEWTPYEIVDPIDHPNLRAASTWAVQARMPDGAMPPLDDANLSMYFNGLLAGPYDDGVLAWEWLNDQHTPLPSTHCTELNVELYVLFDDTLTPAAPDAAFGRDFIQPEGGNAFFRSGWEPDDTWAMFVAEHGAAMNLGFLHEHADNLSVSLYARGQYLLLDPGYIAWEHHDLVRGGNHHNVPTVGGMGPPDPDDITGNLTARPAYIVDGLVDVDAPFVTATSNWRDTDFTRTVFFADDDFLIVLDDMLGAAPSRYGVLWHGAAGGDSGYPFALTADGAVWEREDAALVLHVASSAGPVELATLVNVHGFEWMQQEQHTSLDARAPADVSHGRLLSIAQPYASGETPADVTWIQDDDLVAARIDGARPYFVAAQPEPVLRSFDAADTGSVAVQTSADTFLLVADADENRGAAYLGDGGLLAVAGKRAWGFLGTGRVWATWNGDAWEFDLAEPGGAIVTTRGTVLRADGARATRQPDGRWRLVPFASKIAVVFRSPAH